MKLYDWKRHRPQVEVERPEIVAVAEDLLEGGRPQDGPIFSCAGTDPEISPSSR